MIRKTGMTIDAYLRNAGIRSGKSTPSEDFMPMKPGVNPSFAEDLASSLTANPTGSMEKKSALTITDYLQQAASRTSMHNIQHSTLYDDSLFVRNRFNNRPAASPKHDAIPVDSASRSRRTPAETGNASNEDPDDLIATGIKKAARKFNLSEKLIKAVIQAESNFQVNAVSPAGAQGLMQLMPATARELGVNDPFDVEQNIDGGAGYLRRMLDRFGGDVKLALAAYNAGPGTVEKYNGEVPYRETREYVDRVIKGLSMTSS